MRKRDWLVVVLMVVMPVLAWTEETGSTFTQKDADGFVAYHNKIRKEVGAGEVQWSPELARFAQEWADELAKTGEPKHRPGDGDFAQKYGENWAAGTYRNMFNYALTGWHGEIKFYKPGEPITQEDLHKYGHYTQMVWKDTTKIGAGKAVVKSGPHKGWVIIVCNYDPHGNVFGEKPY